VLMARTPDTMLSYYALLNLLIGLVIGWTTARYGVDGRRARVYLRRFSAPARPTGNGLRGGEQGHRHGEDRVVEPPPEVRLGVAGAAHHLAEFEQCGEGPASQQQRVGQHFCRACAARATQSLSRRLAARRAAHGPGDQMPTH
jgi:hypothetical protein